MRLLVTRPREDAGETVDALTALGHAALVEPLLDIRSLPAEQPDLQDVQALLVTSRNGLRAFIALSEERGLPVCAVGTATAEAARAAGFSRVYDAQGDAAALAALVQAELDPRAGILLHASGRDVAEGLHEPLLEAGFQVRRAVLYEAKQVQALSDGCRKALEQSTLDGVLFFSPRTGAAFADLIEREGLVQACRELEAYCLSPAVGQAVAGLPWRACHTAKEPNQVALLALLEPRLQKATGGSMSEGRDETGNGLAGEGQANAAERVIARFGGIRPMATKLGVAVSTVQGWKMRGHIPAARREQIERAAEELGLELEARDLDDAEAGEVAAGESAAEEAPAGEATSPQTIDDQNETADDTTSTAGTSLETQKSEETPWRSVGTNNGGEEPSDEPARGDDGGAKGRSVLPPMLLGAALVVVGAVVALLLSDLWMPLRNPPPAASIEALEQRMARLEEQRVEGGSGSGRDLEQLRARVEELGGSQAEEAEAVRAELESLRTVSQRLTERVEEAEEASGEGAGGEGIEDLQARVDELAARLEEVAQAPAEADENTLARLEGLDGRIEGVTGRMEALESRLQDALAEVEAARVRVGQETVIALAAGQLRQAMRTGQPYTEELEGLRQLADEEQRLAEVLSGLEAQAETGVTTLGELQAGFSEAASRAVTAERAGEADSEWQAAFWERLSDLVSVRAVGEPEGSDAEAILARAERRLAEGDLAAALEQLDALGGAAAEAMADWRSRAEGRLEAERALDALGQVALTRIGGGEG